MPKSLTVISTLDYSSVHGELDLLLGCRDSRNLNDAAEMC